MNNKTIWIAGTLVLAALGLGTVHAGAHGHDGGHLMKMLKQADANGDGVTTVAEAQAKAQARAAQIDANKDGSISTEEWDAHRALLRAERRAARFARLDVDKDGTVSVSEFAAGRTEHIAKMDRNGDGVLDRNDHARGHAMQQR